MAAKENSEIMMDQDQSEQLFDEDHSDQDLEISESRNMNQELETHQFSIKRQKITIQEFISGIRILKSGYQAINQGKMAVNNAHQGLIIVLKILNRIKKVRNSNNDPSNRLIKSFEELQESVMKTIDKVNIIIEIGKERDTYANKIISSGYETIKQLYEHVDFLRRAFIPVFEFNESDIKRVDISSKNIKALIEHIEIAYHGVNDQFLDLNNKNQECRSWCKTTNRLTYKNEDMDFADFGFANQEFFISHSETLVTSINICIEDFNNSFELIRICFKIISKGHNLFKNLSNALNVKLNK